MMPTEAAMVEVVAAVIWRGEEVLLGCRPAGKPYAGYWEFPGGKVEFGESLQAALARELAEELGIRVRSCRPWITRTHVYPHATVRLNFFHVTDWDGEPRGLERQELAWQPLAHIEAAPLLPANFPVLKALRLPVVMAITDFSVPEAVFLQRLEQALANGLQWVVLRDKSRPEADLMGVASQVAQRVKAAGARLAVNGSAQLAQAIDADALHLDRSALAAAVSRPAFEWVGASCHDRAELTLAAELGCDYAFLSPVLPTRSHPGQPALGWDAFAQILTGMPMPVYALGGQSLHTLEQAQQVGAHGVAMLRAAWEGQPKAGNA